MKDKNGENPMASNEQAENLNTENMSEEQTGSENNKEANDNMSKENTEPNWQEKYEELNNSYLRLNAEFDNYRKRTLKEKAELLKTAGEKLLVDVLPVVDDFERALENISKSEDLESTKKGIELIYDKFLDFLLKNGVKRMEVIGEPFDLDKHEALTTVPAEDHQMKDKIVDSIQHGYTLGDKVIRFPKVIVAK